MYVDEKRNSYDELYFSALEVEKFLKRYKNRPVFYLNEKNITKEKSLPSINIELKEIKKNKNYYYIVHYIVFLKDNETDIELNIKTVITENTLKYDSKLVYLFLLNFVRREINTLFIENF